LLGALGQGVTAQEETTGEPLMALKNAANYERAEKRAALVQAIRDASGQASAQMLQSVIAEVKARNQADDINFVGQCILALGELEAEEATEVLLGALSDPDQQIAYQATVALRRTWEDRDMADQAARQVSVALLAASYSDLPGPALLGRRLAFARVNNVTGERAPAGFTAAELRSAIDRWLLANIDGLPGVGNLPWQVVLRLALVSQDQAVRAEAIQALRQRRELGPVGLILEVLADSGTPEEVRSGLSALLGELTGIPFPPQEEASDSPVAAWRKLWMEELKSRTDAKHTSYAWRELERNLLHYLSEPGDAAAERLADVRAAVIAQLPGPGAIPAVTSAQARDLMVPVLESKEAITAALAVLSDPDAADYDKAEQLGNIEEEIATPHGREVGMQLIEPLAQAAARETNPMFATRLGNVLWYISEIPLELTSDSPEQRREKLTEWAQVLERKRRLSIQLPG
jgi:hypothetical protein